MTFDGCPAATASGVNVLFALIAACAGAANASAKSEMPIARRNERPASWSAAEQTDGETRRRMATRSREGGQSIAGGPARTLVSSACRLAVRNGPVDERLPDVCPDNLMRPTTPWAGYFGDRILCRRSTRSLCVDLSRADASSDPRRRSRTGGFASS